MSYSTEHKRMRPVLDLARKLDIATNPEPDALYESGSGGFQIWCTPEDHPQGWEGVPMNMGAFAQPCAFVGSVIWGWEGEKITHLELETEAYDLRLGKQRPPWTRNRPEDITWAREKTHWLFERAGVPCPSIYVEGEVVQEEPNPVQVVHTGEGMAIGLEKNGQEFRIVMRVDKPEAKGTLILEACAFGFYVYCAEVNPKEPVAILDLFYGSPEAGKCYDEPEKLAPLVVGLFSPGQTEDQIGGAYCYPKETRIRLENFVTRLQPLLGAAEQEYGVESAKEKS